MRQCTKCGEIKNVIDFYTSRGKVRGDCKSCHKLWHKNNPPTPEYNRRKNLKASYNITPEQFDQMIRDGCAICGSLEKLCVDHDHNCCPGRKSCGKCVRGILCERHNKAEGFLRGSAEEALALAEYILRTGVKS